jgi:hypothetical protein
MFFSRTHTYHFPVQKKELTNRLLGKHVKIHNLDFEVLEHDSSLQIIPHAEQVETIKTLPITRINLIEENNGTKAIVKFKMRRLDSGGPMLIIIFSSFMFIAAAILFMVAEQERTLSYTLAGISIFTLVLFTIRMQTGYFDYVRKIAAYVKSRGSVAKPEEVEKEAAVAAM